MPTPHNTQTNDNLWQAVADELMRDAIDESDSDMPMLYIEPEQDDSVGDDGE